MKDRKEILVYNSILKLWIKCKEEDITEEWLKYYWFIHIYSEFVEPEVLNSLRPIRLT